jgi:hypothetical protein
MVDGMWQVVGGRWGKTRCQVPGARWQDSRVRRRASAPPTAFCLLPTAYCKGRWGKSRGQVSGARS